MEISHQEFKEANARLKESLTLQELFKAVKRPLYDYFDGTHGKAIVDDIQVYLGELENQQPDRRITSQWLSTALAGEDYNLFISKLKNKAVAENATGVAKEATLSPVELDNEEAPLAFIADKMNFDSFEEAIKEFILERHKMGLLYSETEIWAVSTTIASMIFGRTDWVNKMTVSLMFDQSSRVKEVSDDDMIYWVEEVTIKTADGDYQDSAIAYSYKLKNEEKAHPSEEEIERKGLERYNRNQMRHAFAWNHRSNKPVTIFKDEYPYGNGKTVLLSNE